MHSSSFRSAMPEGAPTAPLASRDSFGLHSTTERSLLSKLSPIPTRLAPP
jgi:hypothetical protein